MCETCFIEQRITFNSRFGVSGMLYKATLWGVPGGVCHTSGEYVEVNLHAYNQTYLYP
jgi:hypothetical protein